MPAFPALDLSDLDLRSINLPFGLPTVDLTSLDPRKIDLPTFELPNVKLPEVKLPAFDRDRVALPSVDTDRVLGVARDAAYVGVGLTVLAVQQAQVRRHEVQRRVETGLRTLSERVR